MFNPPPTHENPDSPALLAAQDCQRAEQGPARGPGDYEGRPARDPRCGDPVGGRSRDRDLRREVWDEVRQGSRVPHEGDALLTFYDFPAEHWDHLRTSNPIEIVFAT